MSKKQIHAIGHGNSSKFVELGYQPVNCLQSAEITLPPV